MMEDHEVTYIGQDCEENLVNAITKYGGELEILFNFDIIMNC